MCSGNNAKGITNVYSRSSEERSMYTKHTCYAVFFSTYPEVNKFSVSLHIIHIIFFFVKMSNIEKSFTFSSIVFVSCYRHKFFCSLYKLSCKRYKFTNVLLNLTNTC
jgi:hypothetical protein